MTTIWMTKSHDQLNPETTTIPHITSHARYLTYFECTPLHGLCLAITILHSIAHEDQYVGIMKLMTIEYAS